MERLQRAPARAQLKKTLEGAKRSGMVSNAKRKVPQMKPNCTAETKCPTAPAGRAKASCKLATSTLPTNHREVPANWEKTMRKRMNRGATAVGLDIN